MSCGTGSLTDLVNCQLAPSEREALAWGAPSACGPTSGAVAADLQGAGAGGGGRGGDAPSARSTHLRDWRGGRYASLGSSSPSLSLSLSLSLGSCRSLCEAKHPFLSSADRLN